MKSSIPSVLILHFSFERLRHTTREYEHFLRARCAPANTVDFWERGSVRVRDDIATNCSTPTTRSSRAHNHRFVPSSSHRSSRGARHRRRSRRRFLLVLLGKLPPKRVPGDVYWTKVRRTESASPELHRRPLRWGMDFFAPKRCFFRRL